MGQKQQFFQGLKKILKGRGMTYGELAEKLKMSHSNVRRMFSTQSMSFDRFEEICKILDISFREVCRVMDESTKGPSEFSHDQELALSRNQELFSLFYILATGLTYDEVVQRHEFSEPSLTKYLVELDKLGLIELYAENKVKCLFGTDIAWMKHGPLVDKYRYQARKEFWNSQFEGINEESEYQYAKLSQVSMEVVKRKFDKLKLEIDEMSEDDKSFHSKDQLEDMFFIFAYRPFVPSSINFLKKEFELFK